MKAKTAIVLMFVVMWFALGLVAQTAAPATTDNKATCACCNQTGADAQSCCKDAKCCDMKDGKMACTKDCCKDMTKDMAKGKSCCKDGKCEMAKAKNGKNCCGASCKMNKAS